jgi:hypothetical protein
MQTDKQQSQRSSDLPYEERYSAAELDSIIEQGLIYMCACPAQVAEAILKIRALISYQSACSDQPENDSSVHAAICRSANQAHHIMQDCLDTVVALEQWDRSTLIMPEGLRKRQMQELLSGE